MKPLGIAGSAAAGAVLAYFFDPDQGRRRRAMAMQRLGGKTRRLTRRGERLARHAEAEVAGMAARAAHPQSMQSPPPDDVTLARKVETVIFRDADVPKGSINVNAENGVVHLRGQADTPEQVERLADKARAIPGVREVDNLLSVAGAATDRGG